MVSSDSKIFDNNSNKNIQIPKADVSSSTHQSRPSMVLGFDRGCLSRESSSDSVLHSPSNNSNIANSDTSMATMIEHSHHIFRRFSNVSQYYKEYDQKSSSVSPLSVLSNDTLHPPIIYQSHEFTSDDDYKSTSLMLIPDIMQNKRRISLFENIMNSTLVMDCIRQNKIHLALNHCLSTDISNFFPVIVKLIESVPYGMRHIQHEMIEIIHQRMTSVNDKHSALRLKQAIQFYMNTNEINSAVEQICVLFGNEIASNQNTVQMKHNRRPSMQLSNFSINKIIEENENKDESVNEEMIEYADEQYLNEYKTADLILRSLLKKPVGYSLQMKISKDVSFPVYFPLFGNYIIGKMKVKKILQSSTNPYLIDTYDENMKFISSMILKTGDDLRQDSAVMFFFHLLNSIWEENDMKYNGHPIRALTYMCVAISPNFGAIEFVEDCVPLRNISQLTLDSNINNLIASMVGSYIASYVLGVADRHYDNILVRKSDCTLFNIDFGLIQILGQSLPNFQMDCAQFAITQELYQILEDNEKWMEFIETSILAFLQLRKCVQELVDFAKIVFGYHHHCQILTDIQRYLKHNVFQLHLSEDQVSQLLREQLKQSPFNWTTRIKNIVHNWAQTCA